METKYYEKMLSLISRPGNDDYHVGQVCTASGPDPAPEGVISGPRSLVKNYKKRLLNDGDFMNEFKLH